MKKEKTSKFLEITALVVAIIGLTVGFAAYSGTIQIEYEYHVAPNQATFNVNLTSNPHKIVVGKITPTTTGGAVGGRATIDDAKDPVIRHLHAVFSKPGQTVTYKFYARNIGEYKAYLNNIIFNNIEKTNSFKNCYVSKNGKVEPSDETVKKICDGISISVKVGNLEPTTKSIYNINNHTIKTGTYEEIIVTISYNGDVNSSSQFSVDFGDITLNYSSID